MSTISMDSVTIHGVPRIFGSKQWIPKAVWTTVVVVSLVVLVFCLHDRMNSYRKRKTSIMIQRNTSASMNLPSITICDTDAMTDPASFYLKEFPKSCLGGENSTEKPSKYFLDGCKLFMAGVSFSCFHDFGTKCMFPEPFAPVSQSYHCFTFNSDGKVTQSMDERMNGVDLVLFKNSSSSVTLSADVDLISSRVLTRGLQLQVHSPDERIGLSTKDAIYLVPGQEIEIRLKKIVYTRLPAPFISNCSSVSSEKQVIGGAYTVKNCLQSCLFHRMYDICGDILPQMFPFMPRKDYPRTRNYTNESFMNCMWKDVYANSASFNCHCPVPCKQTVYETQVSQRPWRQAAISNKMKKEVARYLKVPESQVDLEFFKQHIIHVSVFYDDFNTEYILEEEMYSMPSLLSDFGGFMGLLLGASTISLMEIVWIFIEILVAKFTKSSQTKVNVISSQPGMTPITD